MNRYNVKHGDRVQFFNKNHAKVVGDIDAVFKYGFTRVIADSGEVYYKHQHKLVKV